MKKKTVISASALVILAMLMLVMASARAEITAAAQLNAPGITIGVDQGSAAEQTVRELLLALAPKERKDPDGDRLR